MESEVRYVFISVLVPHQPNGKNHGLIDSGV